MKIPPCSDELYSKIVDRCYKLIDLHYWDTIEKETLLLWLNNFETPEERYLAISILGCLIFRNKKSIESFGANIFHIILPQLLSDNQIYEIESIKEWETILSDGKSRSILPFRFSTIENIDDLPAKSGSFIYKSLQRIYFDKTLGINCGSIDKLEPKVKAIILFDDIVGTGEQFLTFYSKYNLEQLDKKIIYIPLAAHEKSTSLLNEKYNNLIVHPVEKISKECEFFSEHNKYLNNKDISTPEEFLSYYLDFCENKKIKITNKLGHGNMGLTYCFSESTPNNNLSLLSYKDSSWSALLKR